MKWRQRMSSKESGSVNNINDGEASNNRHGVGGESERLISGSSSIAKSRRRQ
jgi:hypothetical protein